MKTKQFFLILALAICSTFFTSAYATESNNLDCLCVDEKIGYKVGTLFSYHTFMNYENYHPKLTDNGRIVVSPVFLSLQKTIDENEVYSFFTGNDSLGYPLLGGVREFLIMQDEVASSSFFIGFYFIYDGAWRKEVSHPKYYTTILKNYLAFSMPLLGIKNSLTVYRTNNYNISLDFLVSFGLINTGIFFNF